MSTTLTASSKLQSITVTVIVHVIEARHLVAKDSNDLSDPFVRVSVAGRRQNTDIRRNQISATWDQVFMFQNITLTMEEFEREVIMLQVYDANTFLRNELIGQFVFGLSKVRSQPPPQAHQFYDRWVVLTDPDNPVEEQGYLRVTVTVLGPGDVPPSHDRVDDYALARSRRAPKEEKVLSAPNVRRRGYSFAVKVFRGENLPITDTWNKTCDPFVVVKFNGVISRTPHVAQTTSPNWNYLLILPIFTPCFSDTIEIQLWDFVRGQPDRLLATCKVSFTSLLGESLPPMWFHFYGKVNERNSASNWICDIIRKAHSDIDETAYMGSLLMSLNTNLVEEPQRLEKPTPPIKGPKTTTYVLWVDIFQTSEIPLGFFGGKAMVELEFGPDVNKRQSDWCSVSTTGDHLVEFTASGDNLSSSARVDPNTGSGPCQFAEIQVNLPMIEPAEMDTKSRQLYDIIVNVYVSGLFGGQTRVGYLRIAPAHVWGLNNPPEWHPIVGLVNRNGESITPGHLLLSVSFATLADKQQLEAKLQSSRSPTKVLRNVIAAETKKTTEYVLRAHIYQAKNLVPTTEDALVSSQVQVTLGGKNAVLKVTSNPDLLEEIHPSAGLDKEAPSEPIPPRETTSLISDTLNPVWFESLEISNLHMSMDHAEDIKVKVMDANKELIGQVSIPARLCTPSLWPQSKRPRWFRLNKHNLSTFRTHGQDENLSKKKDSGLEKVGGDLVGYILMKIELLEVVDASKIPPIWAHPWPTVRPCELSLATIGLRGLEEYGLFFGSIDNPIVEIHMQSTPNMSAPVIYLAQNARARASNVVDVEASELYQNIVVDSDLYETISVSMAPGRKGWQYLLRGDTVVNCGSVADMEEAYHNTCKTEKGRRLFQHSDFKGNKNGIVVWRSKSIKSSTVEEKKKKNSQSEDDESLSDMEEDLTVNGDLEAAKVTNRSLEQKRREKFTFFEAESFLINMPEDPFYAPSLTIIVRDDRSFSTPIIASCTVSTRDFASAFLYTSEMVQESKQREIAFNIPMYANAEEAQKKLAERAADESDDEVDETKFNLLTGFSAVDQSTESDTARVKIDFDAEQEVKFEGDEVFYHPHEGHKDLPMQVTKDVDRINVIFDKEDLNDAISMTQVLPGDEEIQIDEEEEEGDNISRLKAARQAVTWPIDESSFEGTHTYSLEDSQSIVPAPFRSFKLYRGSIIDETHAIAGIFKAALIVRPKEAGFFNMLRMVVSDYDGSENAVDNVFPKRIDSVHAGTFVLVQENNEIHPVVKPFENNGSYDVWASKLQLFRPRGKWITSSDGYIPSQFIEPIYQPSDLLHRAPDMEFALLESAKRHKTFNYETDCKVPPIISTLESPQHVKVRVYIVAASQLAARSFLEMASDPYLVVKLNVPPELQTSYSGVTMHNDRANFKTNTLDPFFGTWFELDARLPDVTEMDIEVWNANYLSDDLIGSTRIDLEDRWFNPKWHCLRYERKKIKEFRTLRLPGSPISQGLLECWVEMYTPEESVTAPVVDIRAPKTEQWELRLVIWETRRVPIIEDMNYANLWVSGELFYEGIDGVKHFNDESYETDTHTGLKDGRGIYNYRMKFSMEAPCKFPRLMIKVYSRKYLSSRVVGESTIDLGWLLREASISNADFIDRPRSWVGLTHSSTGSEPKGEVDIQMSLVRRRYADEHPVGNAQDPPNENPFLPEPPRESFFSAIFRSVGWGKSLCIVATIIIVIIIVLVVLLKVA